MVGGWVVEGGWVRGEAIGQIAGGEGEYRICLSVTHTPPPPPLSLYNNGFEQVWLFDYGNVNTFYQGVEKKTA